MSRDAGLALTVVVVSYRRLRELRRCLSDLARQRTAARFEVLLVLQAYDDADAGAIERDFAWRMRLRILRYAEGLGVHRARNAALEQVRAPIVAFFDDDVRVPPEWVSTLLPFYHDPEVGGVGGYVAHPGCTRLSARVLRPIFGLSSRRYRVDWGGFHSLPFSSHPERDQRADWLSGCNMSYRREALASVGGFDEAYGHYGFDDVDMGVRVRAAGWRLVSSRRLAVVHRPSVVGRPDVAELVREEEARRVLVVRKAIGHLPRWRARYLARLALHLLATVAQGIGRGRPLLVLSAAAGARRGFVRYATPDRPTHAA